LVKRRLKDVGLARGTANDGPLLQPAREGYKEHCGTDFELRKLGARLNTVELRAGAQQSPTME